MKRKTVRVLTMVVFLLTVLTSTAYAREYRWNERGATNEQDSVLLSSTQRHARAVKNASVKGSLISTAFLDITNAGSGNIEILIETLAHKQCDEIHHKAYLERWDEEHQDWATLESFDFIELQTDNPDETLTGFASVVTIKDQPTGYYYRARGFHLVSKGDIQQSFSTHTDGVLITSEPR